MIWTYTRHRKSLPWILNRRGGIIHEGYFQVQRLHNGDPTIIAWHVTVGPFAWTFGWRRRQAP